MSIVRFRYAAGLLMVLNFFVFFAALSVDAPVSTYLHSFVDLSTGWAILAMFCLLLWLGFGLRYGIDLLIGKSVGSEAVLVLGGYVGLVCLLFGGIPAIDFSSGSVVPYLYAFSLWVMPAVAFADLFILVPHDERERVPMTLERQA